MSEMIEILQDHPLFSGLNIDELEHLESITVKRVYPKRQYVFMEGEPRESVYFIRQGTIKTFKVDRAGNEQIMNLLQKGEMFPHVGFFDVTPYPATAEAIEETELFVIRIEDFDQLIMGHPQIAVKVMRMMGQKIFMLTQRVQALISQDVRHRVIFTLIRLVEESGKPDEKGIRVDVPITNQDLANMVGTSRESINRVLSELKKNQLLHADRHGILVYDMVALKKLLTG